MKDRVGKTILKGDVVICIDDHPLHDALTVGKAYIVESQLDLLITDDAERRQLYQHNRFVVAGNAKVALMSLNIALGKREAQISNILDAETDDQITEALIALRRDFMG